MVEEDLARLPAAPLVLAEGTPLTPAAVGVERAVWLLPTAAVQQRRLRRRGLEPDQGAFRLYELLRRDIAAEVAAAGGAVVHVDGEHGAEATAARVHAALEQPLAAGPHARDAAGRRKLARYANRAPVAQYRQFFARPWAPVWESVRLTLCCECGAAGCLADVERNLASLPVGWEERGPLVATAQGHRALRV
ncbi:hypothetical protein [Streptomyces sulphureus]|uniref:hypothetical protein n=1 Tax=Streptomyces sulphureus TaxID=47758 RepID=UPI00037B7C75|nr:hypothetical protein [Streptomyces sulphureus]